VLGFLVYALCVRGLLDFFEVYIVYWRLVGRTYVFSCGFAVSVFLVSLLGFGFGWYVGGLWYWCGLFLFLLICVCSFLWLCITQGGCWLFFVGGRDFAVSF